MRLARLVDATQYAVVLTAIVAVLGAGIGVFTGDPPGTTKYVLFVSATLHVLYATLLAWPRDPSELGSVGIEEATRLQRLIRRLPPASRFPIPVKQRYADEVRVGLAGLLMALCSYLLEAVVGV